MNAMSQDQTPTATVLSLLQPLKDRLAAQSAYEYGCQIGGLIYPHNSEADARRDARFEGITKRIALRRLRPGHWESVDLPKQTDQAKLIAAIEAVEALAAAWQARGEHLRKFAATVPEDVREALDQQGADTLWHANLVRAALTQALGGDHK